MFGLFKSKSSLPTHIQQYLIRTFGIKSRNGALYLEALRHKSIAKDVGLPDNERLEFLGDAVLDLIVAEYLYENFPDRAEGSLTQMKSRIVSRKTLGDLSLTIGLDEVVHFVDGRYVNKQTICGNALESIIGAMYFDMGYTKTKVRIHRLLTSHLDLRKLVLEDQDYKSQLLVWSQKHKHQLSFELVHTEDLGHEKLYRFQIICNDSPLAMGDGKSKKKAEQLAAKNALKVIRQSNRG